MRAGMPGSEFITRSADAPSSFARVALSSKEQPPRKTTMHRPERVLPTVVDCAGRSWLCAGGKGQPSRGEGNTTSRSRSNPLAEKEAAPAGEGERCDVSAAYNACGSQEAKHFKFLCTQLNIARGLTTGVSHTRVAPCGERTWHASHLHASARMQVTSVDKGESVPADSSEQRCVIAPGRQ